jgi:hypothetical protein
MHDPIVELLEPWGITPQVDRVVFRQHVLPNRRTSMVSQHRLNQWPTDLPITQAISGMGGFFYQPVPIQVSSTQARVYPLAVLSGDDLFASRDFMSQNPQPTAEEKIAQAVVAAAAEKDDRRIVVVGEPVWASNEITTYGRGDLRGLAELVGAEFPANAELFLNSVYWLAQMDQLIAASARTQDIRRVETMTPTRLYTLRWLLLLGMPLAAGGAGVSVWLVRRKG